jgi:hypothetical protein
MTRFANIGDIMAKNEKQDHGEECGCEDMSYEELVESNNVMLNALIDLMIEKNIIAEKELKLKIEEMYNELSVPEETDDSEVAKKDDSE